MKNRNYKNPFRYKIDQLWTNRMGIAINSILSIRNHRIFWYDNMFDEFLSAEIHEDLLHQELYKLIEEGPPYKTVIPKYFPIQRLAPLYTTYERDFQKTFY